MTIQFKTDAVYTLGSQKLLCTYIEDNTVWLKSDTYPASDTTLLYKLDRKSGKLYVFNTKVQAYDLVENTLSEYGSDSSHTSEIWDFRMKGGVSNCLE
jgi:hypothetical protein